MLSVCYWIFAGEFLLLLFCSRPIFMTISSGHSFPSRVDGSCTASVHTQFVDDTLFMLMSRGTAVNRALEESIHGDLSGNQQ